MKILDYVKIQFKKEKNKIQYIFLSLTWPHFGAFFEQWDHKTLTRLDLGITIQILAQGFYARGDED